MSTNISKQKRDDLIAKINKIRDFISSAKQDENTGNLLTYLSELEKDVKGKKYGLVFEEHKENIDTILETHTPVLTEDEEMFIDNRGDMNFLIEGDNLASLQLLEKTHRGKIDVIYIDPPYNTGKKDFKYDDSFVDVNDNFKHSKWISFIKKRLEYSKKILSPNGIIFISIDDNSQACLKMLCDEIFGPENFLSIFIRKTKSMTGDDGNGLNVQHEYLLAYANYKNNANFHGEKKTFDNFSNPDNDPNGIWTSGDPSAKSGGESTYFQIKNPITGQIDLPPKGRYWAFSQETLKKYIDSGRIKFKNKIVKGQRGFIFKRYASKMDTTTQPVGTLCFSDNTFMNSAATTETNDIVGAGKFSYPKPVSFISNIIKFTTTGQSYILDFFAGSGTTGHAVMKLNAEDGGNRKFILCTNNENNICRDITYERIKRVIEKEDYKASLKYYKVDYIPITDRLYYEYADELLLHIRELVELENGVNFNNNSNLAILLTEEEVENFIQNNDKVEKCKKIYLGHDVLLTGKQENIIEQHKIELNIIPEYYYKDLEA